MGDIQTVIRLHSRRIKKLAQVLMVFAVVSLLAEELSQIVVSPMTYEISDTAEHETERESDQDEKKDSEKDEYLLSSFYQSDRVEAQFHLWTLTLEVISSPHEEIFTPPPELS